MFYKPGGKSPERGRDPITETQWPELLHLLQVCSEGRKAQVGEGAPFTRMENSAMLEAGRRANSV